MPVRLPQLRRGSVAQPSSPTTSCRCADEPVGAAAAGRASSVRVVVSRQPAPSLAPSRRCAAPAGCSTACGTSSHTTCGPAAVGAPQRDQPHPDRGDARRGRTSRSQPVVALAPARRCPAARRRRAATARRTRPAPATSRCQTQASHGAPSSQPATRPAQSPSAGTIQFASSDARAVRCRAGPGCRATSAALAASPASPLSR